MNNAMSVLPDIRQIRKCMRQKISATYGIHLKRNNTAMGYTRVRRAGVSL